MCASLLGVERIAGPDDTADACAVAICHHHRAGLRRSTEPARGIGMSPSLEAAVAAATARTTR